MICLILKSISNDFTGKERSKSKNLVLHRSRRNIDDGSRDSSSINDDEMSESFQDSMNDMPNISETKMVAFDAYRDKPFHEDQKYITFDGMKVNVGGGFDPKSGMVSVSDVSNCIDNYFKIYKSPSNI